MTTDRTLVIDTNLWVRRLLVPPGVAAQAVDRALSWGTPLVSAATLAELAEVLSRERFDPYVSRAERQRFLCLLGGVVRVVSITRKIHACRDPKDDKFLDAALGGDAQLILTGDLDLLSLHPFHGIEIFAPRAFLQQTAS